MDSAPAAMQAARRAVQLKNAEWGLCSAGTGERTRLCSKSECCPPVTGTYFTLQGPACPCIASACLPQADIVLCGALCSRRAL
ncbi:MAG: hypothetical protein DBY17_06760 [Oscillospiraceae bacterium]|nr:MAG: hypothetical protein DBY17_06760 [Oscillospiraceae bacterium]